jgi:hypothetical protein
LAPSASAWVARKSTLPTSLMAEGASMGRR